MVRTWTKQSERFRKGVIQPIPEEIDHFEEELKRFRRGEVDPLRFRSFRLQQGTYGQRQPDVNMMRIKIPFGGLTADQLEALGIIAEKYSWGKGHVTTRQNIQFHFMNLDNTPTVMRMLAEVGLTTREACGNTVRNITGCPLAGVCRSEAFDTSPYAAAFARYFVRNPLSQYLPRKFKPAFSGCESDCAITPIHDIGFLAQVQGVNGRVKKGFRMTVGGGLSTMPRYADVLYDFVPVEDYLRVTEAVLRVFDRLGERKNRAKARIKFLVKKLGLEEFRRLVEEELQQPWAQEPIELESLTDLEDESPPPTPRPAARAGRNGHRNGAGASASAFERWKRTNVTPQKQPGYYAAHITLPLGDILSHQFRGLANMARKYHGGHARTSIEQDLVMRFIPEGRLEEFYRDLAKLDLAADGAGTIMDVVSCPGATTCSLAITSSKDLGEVLTQEVRKLDFLDEELEALTIKISGCPNGCGQHNLGSIGLQGASMNRNNRQVPAYDIFLGGAFYEKGARIGERVGKVPAKRVPQAIAKVLKTYKKEKKAGESFPDFIDRYGARNFQPLLEEFQEVAPLHKDIESYLDWGTKKVYKVERGEGECAA
ncbi:MAG: nitrite/sulfite reductase [Dehalococcoidia bacterium]